MSKPKFFICLLLAVIILMVQTGGVFAASDSQTSPALIGTLQSITLETYSTTGMTVVIVTVMDSNQLFQTVHISEKAARDLGLVLFDGEGKLIINDAALGQPIEVKPEMVLPDREEDRHPVGNALATFFSNIGGLDYDTIMLAHNDGLGFGIIAQALWLTKKLEGNADVFQALLVAKETGDFSDFVLEDGTTPKNWTELRKALFEGKKVKNLGSIMSDQDNNGNGNNPGQNNNKDKEKNKDKQQDKDKGNGGDNNGEKDKEKKK